MGASIVASAAGAGRSDPATPRSAAAATSSPASGENRPGGLHRHVHRDLIQLVGGTRDDPQHPLATARELARLMPRATLRVAHTVDEVKTWTDVAKAFLAP